MTDMLQKQQWVGNLSRHIWSFQQTAQHHNVLLSDTLLDEGFWRSRAQASRLIRDQRPGFSP